MPTYYEVIKVSTSATVQEVERALDTQYNQWRRLVTHHDPKVVNQANQSLQMLEQIRDTLTNPTKRAGYDAAIGISGIQVSGLADPEALLRAVAPAPMTPPNILSGQPEKPGPATQTLQRTDAWICPKCQNANAVELQFCAKCGSKIGYPCPKCSRMAELSNPFCPHCGSDKQQVYKQQRADEVKVLQGKIAEENQTIETYIRIKSNFFGITANSKDKQALKSLKSDVGCGVQMISSLLLVVVVVPALYFLAGVWDIIPLFLGFIIYFLFNSALLFFARRKPTDGYIRMAQERIAGYEQAIKKVQARVYPD